MRFVKNATAEELAELVGGRSTDLGRAFLQMPKGVQVKYMMTLRAVAGFMFEPTATIWNTMMDRDEGKVTEPVSMENKGEIILTIRKASEIETGNNSQ